MNRKSPADAAGRVVSITAPIDLQEGDLVMRVSPGTARREGWTIGLSPENLERFAFDGEQNPIYAWLALMHSYIGMNGEPLEAHRLPIPVHLYFHEVGRRLVALIQDGNKTPAAKAAAVAEALGFTRAGWNAFFAFERDAAAHYAVHRLSQARRSGARYEEALDAVGGEADVRTKQRIVARGKRRGARPNPTKPPP